MQLDPRRDTECTLVEPLCRLLESKPELAERPLLPKEWAAHLNNLLQDSDQSETLGWGAIRTCLNEHRHILYRRLNVVPIVRPPSPGRLYQLSLRPEALGAQSDLDP
jgi:hypothetical protein